MRSPLTSALRVPSNDYATNDYYAAPVPAKTTPRWRSWCPQATHQDIEGSLRSMIKGREVALVLPRVFGWVKAIGKHVGIDRLHCQVSKGTNSGSTSNSHGHVLGVLLVPQHVAG